MNKLPVYALTIATVLVGSGCASGSGSHDNGDYIGPVYPASGMYYGSHDYDDYYPEYIVTPRPPVETPEGPGNTPGLHPEHPIANPPGTRPGYRPENRPSTLPADRASSRSRPPSMSHQRARSASIPTRARPSGGMRGGGMRGGGMRGGGRGGGGRRR